MANRLADQAVPATLSLAGRVTRPKRSPLPQRIGGFGGADGMAQYLRANAITHVVDATHPFAAQMSRNAVAACAQANVPLIALTRPPWTPGKGDRWTHVEDMDAAVAALDRPACCVMLAVGRMHLTRFAGQPQHRYILRLVDEPDQIPLPDATVIVDRGPFTAQNDLALMRTHGVDLVVSKNAGGTGAAAKLTAARQLGVPVIMIDRPDLPNRTETVDIDDVLRWCHDTDRGV